MHSQLFDFTGIILSWIPIVLTFYTISSYVSQLFGRSLILTSRQQRTPLISVPCLMLVLEMLYFRSGQILIKEGILNMTQQQLLLEIVTRMNNASRAFILIALISMVVSIICSVANKGNAQEIRHIARSCAWFAFLFWFISWIII